VRLYRVATMANKELVIPEIDAAIKEFIDDPLQHLRSEVNKPGKNSPVNVCWLTDIYFVGDFVYRKEIFAFGCFR